MLWIANTTTNKGRGSMATNYEYDDEDDYTEESTDVVKQLRKVNRTLEKRAKELEQELGSYRSQVRQSTVKNVLTAKGINPKVAAFIPQDIETSEESISQWLNEYGDVFGVNQAEAKSQPSQPQADLSAQARMNNVVSNAQPPAVDEDSMAKILNAKSASELNDILGISVY
jgi:hypothetical protein